MRMPIRKKTRKRSFVTMIRSLLRPATNHAESFKFEPLEERSVPAVFTPTVFVDGGAGSGSLRAAIIASNADGDDGGDEIQLAAGTYTLSLTGRNEDAAATGDLDITDNSETLTIRGAGQSATIINAADIDRVFEIVNPGTTVVFQDLTIRGGLATDKGTLGGTSALGGGILSNQGILTLDNVRILSNVAQGAAGADGSSPTGSSGTTGGDGTDGAGAQGGGLYVTGGALSLLNGSLVSYNQALGGAGGSGGNGASDVGTSTPSGGSGGAGGDGGAAAGGGIYADAASLSIADSSITYNDAIAAAGGIGGHGGDAVFGSGSSAVGGAGGTGGQGGDAAGGGLYVTGASVNVTGNSNVGGNRALAGDGATGGDGGTAALIFGTVIAAHGGDGANAGAGGDAGGGGAFVTGGSLTLTGSNVRVTDNQTLSGSGGVGGWGGDALGFASTDMTAGAGGAGGNAGASAGGGVFASSSTVTIQQGASVSNNAAVAAAGGNGGDGGLASNTTTTVVSDTMSAGDGGVGGVGGAASGGGLYVSGNSLTIDSANVSNNKIASGPGGQGGWGGDAWGLVGDRLHAGNGGDGGDGGDALGAGVHTTGAAVTIGNGSVLADNMANAADGGQGGLGGSVSGLCTDSSATGGQGGTGGAGGSARGGGAFVDGGSLAVTASTFSSNGVRGGAGARGGDGNDAVGSVWHVMSAGDGGTGGAGGDGQGGGLYVNAPTADLETSSLTGNRAIAGNGGNGGAGGDAWGGDFGNATSFFGGDGGDGGNGGNSQGAGLYVAGGVASLVNSTISDNVGTAGGAAGSGGTAGTASVGTVTGISTSSGTSGADGAPGQSQGGGVFHSAGSLTITNSTLATNVAQDEGGGLYNNATIPTLSSTIIANNSSGTTTQQDLADAGSITTASDNLVQAPDGHSLTDGTNGNIVGSDPLLGPLQDNGGTTWTHALQSGSPAIDQGADNSLVTDQRGAGFARTIGLATDIGAFEVDSVIPTATLSAAANVNAASTPDSYLLTIQFADNVAIDVASLGNSNVRVTGPNSFDQLATLQSVDVDSDGTPRSATYQITPPGGAWSAGDDGSYTVAIEAGQVLDTTGNAVAAGAVGTFEVDVIAPTAALANAPAVNASSTAGSYTFTITFEDNVAVDVSTLINNNSSVRVSGPDSFDQLATYVSVDTSTDGTPRTVTYQITPPGGTWDSIDQGTYTIALEANQAFDTLGNAATGGILGTFDVQLTATFSLTGPTSGVYTAGETVAIQWTAGGVLPGSKISLCVDEDTTLWNGNEHWITVDQIDAVHGYGTYNWKILGIDPGTYYVAGYMYDFIDTFTFSHLTDSIQIQAQSFALTGPTSGTFTAGDTVTIDWTASDVPPGSKVSLCYDEDTITWNGNEHWITVDQVDATDLTYDWNTAGVAAGTYYIAGYMYDFDGTFTFSHLEGSIEILSAEASQTTPSFALTAPVSTSFVAGETVAIEWAADGVVAGSKVSLCYDEDTTWWNGNEHWITVDQVDATAGTYNWDTSQVPQGTYYVAGYMYDFAGTFTLSHLEQAIEISSGGASPTVQSFALTGPASGTFVAGETVAIEWTADGVVAGSKVSLCYDEDTTLWSGNEHWITVDQVDATAGTYQWDTTGVPAGTYYIAGYMYDFAGTFTFSHLTDSIAVVAAGSPLMLDGVSGAASDELSVTDVVSLTSSELAQIVPEAIAGWELVTSAEQSEALQGISFVIVDLPGSQLGWATSDTIYIDVDAAGQGWFVDATPQSDEEYALVQGVLCAVDLPASDGVDLLTVLYHELGHTLGLSDLDSVGSLMSSKLLPGVRYRPSQTASNA